jgi:hypothetical protein
MGYLQMVRLTSILAFWLVISSTSLAQPPADKPVSLSLHSAALPKPSLKYRLFPDERDLQPGNAASLYYRAEASFVENQVLLNDIKNEKWDTWSNMSFQNLPIDEVRAGVNMTRRIVAELEQAALRKDCDWMLDGRSEGIGLLLPELQTFRRFASVLAVRARLEIADGQFESAAKTLQTGYVLARHLSEGPTVIHYLVGAAVAAKLTAQLQAFVEREGSPNLYWSLTGLPRPFFDPKHALLLEPMMLERTFPWLAKLDKGVMTKEQIEVGHVQLTRLMDDFGIRKPTPQDAAATAKLFAQGFPAAKEALIKRGMNADDLNKMPEYQIVSLEAYKEYREAWEEGLKWLHLPEAINGDNYKKDAERVKLATERMDKLFFRGLLKGLTEPHDPLASNPVYTARLRHERRIAALRCVEALRLYAAGHNGAWPTALKDITEVFVPTDPVTGKEFAFKATDGKATLESPKSDGKGLPVPEVVFELTLKKP